MRPSQIEWIEVDAWGKNGWRNVIHLFERCRPGQVRSVPYLAPVIENFKQLARYSKVELQAAVWPSSLKWTQTLFKPCLMDGAQINIQGASSWDGGINTDLDGPGKAVNLLPGESVDVPNLGRPNTNYDPFFFSMLKQIGTVLEIPFEVLIKELWFEEAIAFGRISAPGFFQI